MSGLVGAGAFAWLIVSTIFRVANRWRWLCASDRLEIVGVGGFWFVDLGAEGYVYGVGSVLSLAFWLWLGRVTDQLDMAAVERARAGRAMRKGAE
jgi:hypothetical protein